MTRKLLSGTLVLSGFVLLLLFSPAAAQVLFEDVTAQYQLDDTGTIPNLFWYDYDNDGDQDLLCPHRFFETSYLFRNDGDRFTRLSDIGLPVDMDGGKTIPMDFDHDGDMDLFISSYSSPSVMLVNQDGIFTDRTAELGLPVLDGGRDYQWVDFNQDGWMDILFCNAAYGFKLFRNDHGTHFTDVTASTQLPPLSDFGRTCEADFDLDGDVDIFMTRFTGDDHLYVNLGNGVFEDRTISAGLSGAVGHGGCEWVDINNDKLPDILTQGPQRHAIWLNNGDGTFSEMNVHGTATDFDTENLYGGYYSVADFDMDGDQDFYFNRLEADNLPTHHNQLFIQDSISGNDIWFHDAAAENGMDFTFQGYSDVGDFDGDGRMDIYVSPSNGPGHLFHNIVNAAASYLQVQVLGPNGERDRWHSRVELYPHGSSTALGVSELNTSNVSRNGFNNYFVLNPDEHYDLRVYFISGTPMMPAEYPQLSDIVPSAIGHHLTVYVDQQTSPIAPSASTPQAFLLMTAYPNPFNSSATFRYSLPNASAVRLAIYDVQGRLVTELEQGQRDAGEHRINWNAGAQASGIYFAVLDADGQQTWLKTILLK
jgi:hypothetical protein